MAGDEGSLRALEGLMGEFFAIGTGNDRKREIESLLNNFGQQRDAWKHCLYFMANTNNEYVMMYCMNVLEDLINRQWVGLPAEDKMEIRGKLNLFLLSHHEKVPSFVRNKLVKLVVDIGRLDWPHFYPDFFSSILQLVQQTETVTLGLILLQTTSEELASPREDLSVARKEELNRLLLHQVPVTLGILNDLLDSILEKHRSMVTATPPPSPTHGQSSSTLSRSPMSVISSSPVQSNNLLSNMFRSPQARVPLESLPPLDTVSGQVSLLALNCLSHLFSWIPLSSTITPALLSTIFHYAAFGCEASPSNRGLANAGLGALGNNITANTMDNQPLGVLAMCCINELLSKNCVPQEFEEYLLQMFQQTFYLLQRITKDSTTTSSGNRLSELDESYIDKFTEFLRLFVSIHLRRFESNSNFPVLEFLSLLFKYTFKQPSHEGFYACLDIWTVFLDYIATTLGGRGVDKQAFLGKYQEALLSLATEILNKIQFRFNQSQLDELDDETLDDDLETEWQHFLRQCLETIARVAELLPADVFRLLYQPFQEYLEVYLGLEQWITPSSTGRRLNITAENECRKLHCALRDLSSLLQALGRLAEHFIGEKFVDRFNDAQTLIDRLIYTAAYGTKVKLYEADSIAGNVLKGDFIEVHAQSLAAVKANTCWLAQFYTEALQNGNQNGNQKDKCVQMISTLVPTLVPLFHKQVPEKVQQSGAHLLLSVFVTVRPAFLITLPEVQSLYNTVSRGHIDHCSLQVQLLVIRALSHFLLLPWPVLSESDQDWNARASHHTSFIQQIMSGYQQFREAPLADNKALQESAKPHLKKSLQILTDLVESVAVDGTSKSKQICYQSLQQVVQTSLVLFPIYIHQTDETDDILGFFLALFQGLRVQMGTPVAEQIIKIFMSLFTREQLVKTIQQETTSGYKVVEKFLKILEVIVHEPGSAFKTFLPNTISICMDHIYPIIAERSSPDLKPVLYELLHQILLHKWRYFFKSSVLHKLENQNEVMDHQQQFSAIMQAFGQSFLQPDIAVFKQNLEALENLNQKWKLYHKRMFRTEMMYQFFNVLIQVLIVKSHEILQEEIGIAIYNMASVDFDFFFGHFLQNFLATCEGLDENQKTILAQNFPMDKDLPSFTHSIHRFVNDLRYYRICNSSLPEGSVKL